MNRWLLCRLSAHRRLKGKPQILQPLDTGVRVIGECFQTYIIAEDKDGLILIDKHAAHERILFNKLRAETDMPQQQLLTPVIVELTGEEAAAVQSQIEDILSGRLCHRQLWREQLCRTQRARLSG